MCGPRGSVAPGPLSVGWPDRDAVGPGGTEDMGTPQANLLSTVQVGQPRPREHRSWAADVGSSPGSPLPGLTFPYREAGVGLGRVHRGALLHSLCPPSASPPPTQDQPSEPPSPASTPCGKAPICVAARRDLVDSPASLASSLGSPLPRAKELVLVRSGGDLETHFIRLGVAWKPTLPPSTRGEISQLTSIPFVTVLRPS